MRVVNEQMSKEAEMRQKLSGKIGRASQNSSKEAGGRERRVSE